MLFRSVFFRAPAEGSLPRPPFLSSVLTVHNPQPPFCLHFSCPYVSLSICAFWLSHFYSFTPSSLLSCPPIQHAYSCVLLFSPLLPLFFFPLSSCSSSPPITLQVQKNPLFSPCEIQKYPNFVTYHHFFHENLLAFQNLGIYFAPRNRNNEILSLLISPVSPVLPFLPFPLPRDVAAGGEGWNQCLSFIVKTAAEPINRNTPATTIIIGWFDAPFSATGIRLRIAPPSIAATICGRQIVPLKRPRYVPI